MSWSIKECHLAAILQCHAIRTNVLRDTAGFTGNDVGIADMVEQRSLTVVHMAHHGHNRSTRHEISLIVFFHAHGLLHLSAHIFGGETKLFGHQINGLRVKTLVDRHHDTYAHEGRDDLRNTDIHHRGKLAYRHELGELQRLALCCQLLHLLVQALLHGLALLTAILCSLLVLVLVGKACQRLLYLTCNILLIHLKRLGLLTVFLVLLSAAVVIAVVVTTVIVIIVVIILVLVIVVSAALVLLLFRTAVVFVGSSLNIHTLLVDALALFLLAVHLGSLFLTLLPALLLGFLLRASALVEG